MASELEGKQLLPLHLGASTADKFLLEANAVKYLGAKSEDKASVEDALTQLFAAVGGKGVVASVELTDNGTKLKVTYADGSENSSDIKQTEIVDNLTSDSTEAALSAAQGKALKGLIDALKVKNLVAGNGIKLDNNDGEWTISVPVTDADGFLTSDADGIKLTGVKTAISNAVDAEATRAKAAEKVNADAISVLNGDSSTAGSVAKAVADAKSDLLGDAATEYNTLGKLEDKIQEVDAKASAAHTKVNAKADGHVTVSVEEKTTAEGVAYSEVTVAESDIASADDLTAEITRAKKAEETNATAISTEVDRAKGVESGLDTRLTKVEGKIPTEASSTNQLADKAYVDDAVDAINGTYVIEYTDTGVPTGTYSKLVEFINSNKIPSIVIKNADAISTNLRNIAYVSSIYTISNYVALICYSEDSYNTRQSLPFFVTVYIQSSDGSAIVESESSYQLAKNSDVVANKVTAADKSLTVSETSTGTTAKVNISSTPGLLTLESDGLSAKEVAYTGSNAINVNNHAIGLNIDTNDKILSQSESGLLSTLSLSYNSTDKKIYLYGKDSSSSDKAISSIDATNFIKDGMLKSAEYSASSHILTLTFNTDAGAEPIKVDLSDLVDTYKAGDGLALADDGTFSVDSTVVRQTDLAWLEF